MSNNIMIFENESFGKVRTIMIDNEPWFIGKDVAEKLGYKNSRDALIAHIDNEDKSDVGIHDGSQNRKMVIINESGLYSLILSSKMPNAKKFKRWVTSEILPEIRKSGHYLGKADSALRKLESSGLLEEFSKLSEVDRVLKYFELVKENAKLKAEVNKHARYIDDFIGHLKHCNNKIKETVSEDKGSLIDGGKK